MYTLILDTSTYYLAIGLLKDNELIATYQEESLQKQSEHTIPQLQLILNQHHIKLKDIKKVVLTIGPGTYTGVRIALSIVKTLAVLSPIEVYTLSTLQAYCPFGTPAHVLIDAKGGCGFYAHSTGFKLDVMPTKLNIADLKIDLAEPIMGDAQLLNRPKIALHIIQNIIAWSSSWKSIVDVTTLVPEYLKVVEAKEVTQ